MDPVSLIVAALVAGASAGVGEAASSAVKDAYAALRSRLGEVFDADPVAKATLEQHAVSPEIWDKPLRQQIRRLGVDQDAEAVEAAQRVLTLVDNRGARSGATTVSVGDGRADLGDRGIVQQHGASAGRDIRTRVDNSRRRTTIAVGGIAVALVLLFGFMRYSASKAASDELASYQQGVLATCERIKGTGTAQLNPQIDEQEPVVLRKDILAGAKRGGKVRQEQIGMLLQRKHPDSLVDEWRSVDAAEKDVLDAQPALYDEIRTWPKKIKITQLQELAEGPAAAEYTDRYRRLGDSLTRLANNTCAIEG